MVHDMVEHQHIGFPVNRRMQVFLASEKGMQFLLHLLTGNYTTVAMANKLYNKRVERDGRQHISHFAHILRMAKNLGLVEKQGRIDWTHTRHDPLSLTDKGKELVRTIIKHNQIYLESLQNHQKKLTSSKLGCEGNHNV